MLLYKIYITTAIVPNKRLSDCYQITAVSFFKNLLANRFLNGFLVTLLTPMHSPPRGATVGITGGEGWVPM